jgi:HAD superfamily hydrolase (TIGR01509 family)
MAVGTGSNREKALDMLNKTGLLHYFDCVVTADDVEHGKPHPETFLRCAQLMGVDPEFCHVFEDGPAGLAAARDAGMMLTDVKPYYVTSVWN